MPDVKPITPTETEKSTKTEQFKLVGLVTKMDRSPVDSVKVNSGSTYFTYTDREGNFELNFPSRTGRIIKLDFRKAGYEPFSDDFPMPHNEIIKTELKKLK